MSNRARLEKCSTPKPKRLEKRLAYAHVNPEEIVVSRRLGKEAMAYLGKTKTKKKKTKKHSRLRNPEDYRFSDDHEWHSRRHKKAIEFKNRPQNDACPCSIL